MIYAHTDDALYVNMFIPSVVTWDKGISIHQETAFPDKVLLVLLFPERLFFNFKDTLSLIGWEVRHSNVIVNGKREKIKGWCGWICFNKQAVERWR